MPGQVSQMFEQSLDALKGWFQLSALDKSAKLDATLMASATEVPAGRVAVLNDVGEFVINRSTVSAPKTAMPIFLWNGKTSADVYNDGKSPTTSLTHWFAISPTGVMSGLVATGGYELQTTEFDTAQSYIVNQPLTADNSGVLSNQTAVQFANWICGICSTHVQAAADTTPDTGQATNPGNPVGNNAHGISVLTFWSYFLPQA